VKLIMVISDDRWTCPECERTFVVRDPFEQGRGQLAAVRATHAAEHTTLSQGLDASGTASVDRAARSLDGGGGTSR